MALSTVTNIRQTWGVTTAMATNTDVEAAIARGYNKVLMLVGRSVLEKFKYFGHNRTKYLYFKPILSITRVWVNTEDNAISLGAGDDEYAKDLDEASVTLGADAVSIGYLIFIEYVPTMFKDLEMLCALEVLIMQGMVYSGETSKRMGLEDVKAEINMIEATINARPQAYPVREQGGPERDIRLW